MLLTQLDFFFLCTFSVLFFIPQASSSTRLLKINMVRREDTLSGIYDFRSKRKCDKLGVTISVLPSIARRHMVLVVDIVRRKPGFVKVMTVS